MRVAWPNRLAAVRGTFRMMGRGYQIKIPTRLKSKWANATFMAVGLERRAARMAVKVVPRLAPRMSGNICSSLKAPTSTRGVKTEVVIEEDWTNMVRPVPIAS